MLLLLLLLLAVTGDSVEVKLPQPNRSYKILLPIPGMGRSQQNVFKPLMEALADRGHKIVTLQGLSAVTTHPNITEIVLPLGEVSSDRKQMFDPNSLTGGLEILDEILLAKATKFYSQPKVKELYRRRHEFDVVITGEIFSEMAYPFAQGVPLILVSTRGLDSRVSAVLGNVHHPAYVPNFLTDYPFPMSLLDRLRNLFYHLYIPWYWGTWSSVRNVQEEVSRHLPDIPPLLDIERNISLCLVNQNTVSGPGVPYLPSEVDVGGLHCVPGRPLPKTLDSWLEGAGASGVIYFSLGTVAQGINMPTKHKDLMVKAFAALPQYRFIWKFESTLVGVSDNVLVDKYLPQQDILADPRVKLFITHGGCLSKQEAIYHATPLLVLPIFGDQPRNAMEVVKRGIGLSLRWDEVTVDLLVNTIQELINNPRYDRNVRKASELARDQLQSPLERAVFWTEYVVRHGGAPQLKSPAAQLSWVEFLMLDVLALALLLALILCLALRRSMRAAVAMLKRVEWKTKTD